MITTDFEERLKLVESKLFSLVPDEYNGTKVIFVSLSDGVSKAKIMKASGEDWRQCWTDVSATMRRHVATLKNEIIWIKVDWVTEVMVMEYKKMLSYLDSVKPNYFKFGISLDERFKLAFLEQEINANAFIQNDLTQNKSRLAWKNVNEYIKQNYGLKVLLSDAMVKHVLLFRTNSIFHDGKTCFMLDGNLEGSHRRKLDPKDPNVLEFIIRKASGYLAAQIKEDGQYHYGHFPRFDKSIDHYNILRHASTTYSLTEAYELFRDPALLPPIEKALEHLVKDAIISIPLDNGITAAFVIEKSMENEIKLGANAAAILSLAKFSSVCKSSKYDTLMEELANGVVFMQRDDGGFVHVLNSQDLSVKETSRIIYYDGEAVFALLRLYHLNGNPLLLAAANRAFRYFINEDYWKHHDHWLSYASYEFYRAKPETEILAFNLKNAEGILDFSINRETTYPTLLELLLAATNLIDYAKKTGNEDELITSFDLRKMDQAVSKRVEHQLNGFMFPEIAMYFKSPQKILWSFFIRHHSFRVRIDDVEHNLSGYCSFYQMMLGNTVL